MQSWQIRLKYSGNRDERKIREAFRGMVGALVSAYIIVTAISVFLGVILGKYIRLEFIRYTGALLFIAIGIMMWLGKI